MKLDKDDRPEAPEEEPLDTAPEADERDEAPDPGVPDEETGADEQDEAPDAGDWYKGHDAAAQAPGPEGAGEPGGPKAPDEAAPPAKSRKERRARHAKPRSGRLHALWGRTVGHRKELVLAAAALVLVLIVIPFMLNASKIGRSVGGSAGEKVGIALGSVEGLAQAGENYEAGKQAGLTADDIDVVVESAIRGTGRLQVLAMKGKATDLIKIGEKFNARIGTRIDVIFTVDLASASVENGTITLDEPVAEGNIDENDMDLLDSSDTSFWGVDGNDTYTATMNALNLLRRESKDPSKYAEWLPQAEQAAEDQILALVRAIHGNAPGFSDPKIVWRGADEGAPTEG